MKIAMIGQKGVPAQAGGVEKHVQEIGVRLAKTHDVIAYTRPYYTAKQLIQFNGIRLISLPTLRSKHLDAISHTFLAIMHATLVERADIIHIHAVGPALLAWLPRILRPKAKVVITFHCIDRQHQKWNGLAKLMLFLGEWSTMKFSHEVIAVSRTLQQYAYEMYHRSVTYIPNGINQVQAVPAQLIKQQFDLEQNSYILMVARLVRHKGAHHLIRAYQQLQTDKKLVIVGGSAFTDHYVDELHELAKTNPNVIFTGNQTGKVLEELFSNAYLYVLPSESEGLPIALLEAASYGKAILASDIPANLEITQHCGYIFKNTNVEDLRKQLDFLLHQPTNTLVESGKNARKFVYQNYLWDDSAKTTLDLYKNMLYTVPYGAAINYHSSLQRS